MSCANLKVRESVLTPCFCRFDHDPRWSETGDRYVVKLFRDFVFHSVNEQGRPLVDLSHILTNLNKLDAGSDEKIMLTSRDGQSCLVASYRDVSCHRRVLRITR